MYPLTAVLGNFIPRTPPVVEGYEKDKKEKNEEDTQMNE